MRRRNWTGLRDGFQASSEEPADTLHAFLNAVEDHSALARVWRRNGIETAAAARHKA